MIFLWCKEDHPIARCEYEGTGSNVRFIRYEVLDHELPITWHMLPIPKNDETLYRVMAERVVPKFRFNPFMAEEYGTVVYNPEVMCRTTHGACPADPCWMRYEDDPDWLRYGHVAVQ